MIEHDLRTYFDAVSVDSAVQERVEARAVNMAYARNTGHVARRSILIMVAATLLIVSAAFALNNSRILSRLFLNHAPSQDALNAIVTDGPMTAQDGITLSIDEYLFDNKTAHVAWTVSSTRAADVYYATDYALVYASDEDAERAENSVGGSYGGYGSWDVGDNALVRLTKDVPNYSGNAGFGYDLVPEKPIEAVVTIRAYETDLLPIEVDDYFRLRSPEEGDTLAVDLEKSRQIGYAGELSSVDSYQAFESALNKLVDEGVDWDEANKRALVESGLLKLVTVLKQSVMIEPGEAVAPHFSLDEQRTFKLPDLTLTLNELTIDTASTVIRYEVLFDEPILLVGGWSFASGLRYLLFDQDGHLLNIDNALNMSIESDGDGEQEKRFIVTIDGNPLPETVSSIRFVPMYHLERHENEPSDVFYLRMAEMADAGAGFTVDISQ